MGFWVRYADFITHGTAKHHHHICVSFHCKWLRWMPTHTENCVIGNKPQAFPHSSVGKESTCSEGDLGSIPGLRRSPGKGKGYPLQCSGLESSMDCVVHGVTKGQTQLSAFHTGGSVGKGSACNARDLASVPGLGRPPGEGNGNPLQYSCLGNPSGQKSLGGLQLMGSQRAGHD